MKFFRCLIERAKNQLEEIYVHRLLTGSTTLEHIPKWLRMGCRHTVAIHIAAFRADRGISRAQYERDLVFLEAELALAQTIGNKPLEAAFKKCLEWGKQGLVLFERN